MERQLFDKTLPELRESFVRARFAEPKMFGRPDVLEWLADPEWVGIIDFDAMPAVVSHAEEAWRNLSLADDLLQFATPYVGVNGDYIRRFPFGDRRVFSVLQMAIHSRSQTFFPWVNDTHAYPVSILWNEVVRLVPSATEEGPALTIHRANARDVLEIYNAEIKGAQCKANAARTFLNRIALSAVARIRKSAESDFDEAVAVSADGTKIVKAKWVIAVHVERNGKALLYPASAFWDRKILRVGKDQGCRFQRDDLREPRHLRRVAPGWHWDAKDPVDQFLCDLRQCLIRGGFEGSGKNALPSKPAPSDEVARFGYDQLLVTIPQNVLPGVESVLVASVYHCPSPLPEGGREIS